MTVKLNIEADSAKARAEFDKVAKAEKVAIANVQTLIKETEKLEKARLKELEIAQRAKVAAKEAADQAKKLGTENERLTKQNERLAERLAKNASAQDDMFARGLANVRTSVAGYFSAAAAVNVWTQALQHQKQVSQEALTASERIARSQRQVMLNMPGASSSEVTSVDQRIRAAAARSRAPDLAAFYESVASSSAATGGNIDAAIRGTEATVPFTRLAPQDLPVISAAALEIGKAAGSDDYERSIGMLLQVGGVTRQPDTAAFARSLPEALAAGAGTSTDKVAGMEFAAEAYATLSNRVADVTGKQTSTAVANLVVKMDEFFQKRPDDPGTPGARFAAIQANPSLREEFLKGLGGEVIYKPSMQQMFTPGTDTANELVKNQAAIDYGSASDMYASTAANVTGGTAELRQAETQSQFAGAIEDYLLDPSMSRQANAGKVVEEAIRKANPSGIGWTFGGMGPELTYDTYVGMGYDPVEVGQARLQEQISARQGSTDPAVQKQIELLEKAVRALEELNRQGQGSGSAIEQDRN